MERLKKALQRSRERLSGYHIIGTAGGEVGQWIWRTGKAVRGFGAGQAAEAMPEPSQLPPEMYGDGGDIQL
ncbi:hypothetical protein DOI34_24755 [Salmonella enterica subsp. enterica serovar Virchow]|nr:hypothetical protein [Salmonella enterica subsp. enterica serovar Virchow]